MKLLSSLILIPLIRASSLGQSTGGDNAIVVNIFNIEEDYCVKSEVEAPLVPPPKVETILTSKQLHDDLVSLPTDFHRSRVFLTIYKYVVGELIKYLNFTGSFTQADQSLKSMSLLVDYAAWYMSANEGGLPQSVLAMMTTNLEKIAGVLYAIPKEISTFFADWNAENNEDAEYYLPDLQHYFNKFTNYLTHCPQLFRLARKTGNQVILDTLISQLVSIVTSVNDAKLPNSLEVDIMKARFIAEVWRRLLHDEEEYSNIVSIEMLNQKSFLAIKNLEDDISKAKLSFNTITSNNVSPAAFKECQSVITSISNQFVNVVRLLSCTDMPANLDLLGKRRKIAELRELYRRELVVSSGKSRLPAEPKALFIDATNNLNIINVPLNYLGYHHASNLIVYLKSAQLDAQNPIVNESVTAVCSQYLKLFQLSNECADVAGQLIPAAPAHIKELGLALGGVYKRYITPYLPDVHRLSGTLEGSLLLDDLDAAFKRRRELKSHLNNIKFIENNNQK